MPEKRVINFGAGPSQLPEPVLHQIKEDLFNFSASGTGIFEISHRSKTFLSLQEECQELLRQLLKIGSDYSILFTTGGATQQFSMVPMNLLKERCSADYILTDHWSEMALAEARKIGKANVAASSKEQNYQVIPIDFKFNDKATYCHFTSNNTIFGTQFQNEPPSKTPLICDASSDLLSRQIDVNKYGLIYAGAQKNLGVAGVCIVIMKNCLLKETDPSLPVLMDYQTYIKHTNYNTPPVFAIYVLNLVLKWLRGLGGVEEIEKTNRAKAQILYDYIDQSKSYQGIAASSCRSITNVTFRIYSDQEEKLEQQFIEESLKNGLIGLKGHRLIGGLRASLYNAISLQNVNQLISFMQKFENKFIR
jgi:phosphoserine aminotransferase